MSAQLSKHVVEFWPKPSSDCDRPHEVVCANEAEAIALEEKFHGVGWAARAVTITVQRSFPTAGRSLVCREGVTTLFRA